MTKSVAVSRAGRIVLGVLVVGTACIDLSTSQAVDAKLDAVKAYYCAQGGQATCVARGALIPAGTLPPANEAFQVWAFYKGWVTTNWRLLYGQDSLITEKLAPDSSYVWLNFNGASAHSYTIHVAIRGPSGFLTRDSLQWTYP